MDYPNGPWASTPSYWRLRAAFYQRVPGVVRWKSLAGLADEFDEHLVALREQHHRRPILIAMLDKAKLV